MRAAIITIALCLSTPAFAGGSKSAGESKPPPKAVTEKKEKVCEQQCLEYDEAGRCKKSELRCK